jgi:hypothetical protein
VRADVVQRQLIDSVQVTTVLPYRLWEIAEKLARLTMLRATHRDILRGIDASDPGVAAVLDPQRRAHALAAKDVDQRIRDLEVLADRVDEADAAVRRKKAVEQLTEQNEPHWDLLARLGPNGNDLGMTEQTYKDVQAVIDQANRAVREANQAGRSLALPGDRASKEA